MIFQWESLFFGFRAIEHEFAMRVFVWPHACLTTVLCLFSFELRVFWKPDLFFQRECLFFGLRPIENWFFNESVCFLVSGIVEDGAVPFFTFEFKMFLRPELFFNESLCFFVSGLLKMDFSMRVFVFWSEAYWFFWMLVFVFLVSGLLKIVVSMRVFFGVKAIENWFFNESLCFFGLRHCGRRCCAFFRSRSCSVFKTRIIFSMRVFVFLVSGIVEDGAVPFLENVEKFFHMNLILYADKNNIECYQNCHIKNMDELGPS